MDTKHYPKISVVTTSFNQGHFLEDTILSVLNQNYPNLEYIIIDGASTDNSVEIIKKYSDKLTYWISEKDKCHSEAINKGFRKATGEIINWLNSDDQLLPNALFTIAKRFEENPDATLIHGRIEYFGDTKKYYSHNYPSKDLETRYVAHISFPQPSCYYRRRLIDEQGLCDETLLFSMDYDLFLRGALHYKIVQVEDVLVKFRLHSTSKSVSSFSKKFLTDNALIFCRALTTLGFTNALNEMKQLGLYTEPSHLYNPTQKKYNENLLLYYFLEHRLKTLYFHGEKNEFKKTFCYLFKRFKFRLLRNKKILLYRFTLFFPSKFLNTLSKIRRK